MDPPAILQTVSHVILRHKNVRTGGNSSDYACLSGGRRARPASQRAHAWRGWRGWRGWRVWRDGGFGAVILAEDATYRNRKRDPHGRILLAEHVEPNRGVEVRGIPRCTHDEGTLVAQRSTRRYLGPERTRRYMQEL